MAAAFARIAAGESPIGIGCSALWRNAEKLLEQSKEESKSKGARLRAQRPMGRPSRRRLRPRAQAGKIKNPLNRGFYYFTHRIHADGRRKNPQDLDGSGDLAGAQAPGTDVDMAGRTGDQHFYALHIRLPGPVRSSV